MSLVALLAQGEPYHRFTPAALMDPNGFAGVNGIFRFSPDGTSGSRMSEFPPGLPKLLKVSVCSSSVFFVHFF